MNNTEQVLAWIHGIRGEPVAVLLANCDRDELIAYKDSLERSAILKGESLPPLPTPAEAAEILGIAPPEDGDASQEAKAGPAPEPVPTQPKPAMPAATAAEETPAAPDSEEERRGKALKRITKLMRSVAGQLHNAQIERLETFAANLEGNFRSLAEPDGAKSAPAADQPPGGQPPADPKRPARDGRSVPHQWPSTGRAPPNRPS